LEKQLTIHAEMKKKLKRGISNEMRANQEWRAVAEARTRRTDLEVRLEAAVREKAQLLREKEATLNDRMNALHQELGEVVVEVERVRSQMVSTAQRIFYAGGTSTASNGTSPNLSVIIHRGRGENHEKVIGSQEAEVRPGDVVEVIMHAPRLDSLLKSGSSLPSQQGTAWLGAKSGG
jgi:hypothetical protein